MKLSRTLEMMPKLVSRNIVPQGVVDEGRIFALGSFSSANLDHERVVDVVEGLKDQVLQPFSLHPWAFVFDYFTLEVDGESKPMTLLEVVRPQADGVVDVSQFLLMTRRTPNTAQFRFHHTRDGTKILRAASGMQNSDPEEIASLSQYPLAVAILNTRGCRIDLKRAPSVKNTRRKRLGKSPIPAHYNTDAGEYLTALNSPKESVDRGGIRASPRPHLRRAHERVQSDGKRSIIPPALVNVRTEGDIAFVERRKAYKRLSD